MSRSSWSGAGRRLKSVFWCMGVPFVLVRSVGWGVWAGLGICVVSGSRGQAAGVVGGILKESKNGSSLGLGGGGGGRQASGFFLGPPVKPGDDEGSYPGDDEGSYPGDDEVRVWEAGAW